MIHLIPPEVLELLLFAVLIAVAVIAVRAVRRRRTVQPNEAVVALPDLETEVRVHARVRRIFRDPDQGAWLVEATVGALRLNFCTVDYAENRERYAALPGKTDDFALYALGTLELGGIEAMRAQILDYSPEKYPADLVRLVPAGAYANDYAIIGRVFSERDAHVGGGPVTVYRVQAEGQSAATLFLDIAVETDGTGRFPARSLVHGSARLYGYLAA